MTETKSKMKKSTVTNGKHKFSNNRKLVEKNCHMNWLGTDSSLYWRWRLNLVVKLRIHKSHMYDSGITFQCIYQPYNMWFIVTSNRILHIANCCLKTLHLVVLQERMFVFRSTLSVLVWKMSSVRLWNSTLSSVVFLLF